MKGCAVKGCSDAAKRRVWCTKHYTRFIRHGDPEGGGYGRGNVQKWLLDHIGWAGDDCLIWPFYRDPQGYARINVKGKDRIAARVMCIKAHGIAPSDAHQAAHSCGKGHLGCVNPKHIRWALPVENNFDKRSHGTQPKGEDIWCAKLREADVRRIRAHLLSGLSQRRIAAEFGVSQRAIFQISSGKSWVSVK